MNNQPDSISTYLPVTRIYTALVSLVLSVFAFYSDDLINSDGIMYLQMAQAFLDGGFSATQQIYDWPFFSILVAGFHSVSSLSLGLSAVIINSGLFVLLTDALLLISSKLVSSRIQLITAAILILSFFPINEYRDFIVRDLGYWAFCSVALYQFIKFIEQPKLGTATYWQVAISLAILFRVEGIVILIALPLYSFFIYKPFDAIKHSIQLSYLVILAAAILGTTVIGQSGLEAAFGKLSSLTNYINFEHFSRRLAKNSDIIANKVLNHYSAEYSTMILVAGLLYMLLFKLIKAFSFYYIALSGISLWREKKLLISAIQPFFIYFITVNFLILTIFLFKQYFISSRYAVMLIIALLMLFLPVITQTIERAWTQKHKPVAILITLLIVASVIDGFSQSNSKSYIKETARWASDNLPADAYALTDDQFIHYYFTSNAPNATLCVGPVYQKAEDVDYRGVTAEQYEKCRPYTKQGYHAFDYLIVVEKHKHHQLKAFLETANVQSLFELDNQRGNKAVVYKIMGKQ